MSAMGFSGEVIADGNIERTLKEYLDTIKLPGNGDMVFIGGSTFVVAEALQFFDKKKK